MKNFKRYLEERGQVLRITGGLDREYLTKLVDQNYDVCYTVMKYDVKSGTGEFVEVYPVGTLYRQGTTGRTVVDPQGFIIEVRTKRELNELVETLERKNYTWFHLL